MTWIVGASSPFGVAAALSDIRVTLADGSERDCLQKIYPVGPFLAMGFAGSVAIGFSMVAHLSLSLSGVPPDCAWMPDAVADWWPTNAREIFHEAPPAEQESGCQLLLAGVHPTQGFGPPEFARPYVYTFSCPVFEPKLAAVSTAISIGSGAFIDEHRRLLENLSAWPGDHKPVWFQTATMGPRGLGLGFALSLTRQLQDMPQRGISPHLHVCIVTRGQIQIAPNDYVAHAPDGTETPFRMPAVARSMREFCDMLGALGLAAGAARC
jgi:hypothetical protein